TGQLAGQFRQRLGGCGGGAGFGNHHVQRGGTATARTLVEVVQQVLVVGVGVHCFHVTDGNAELVVQRLQRRHDRIGGAAGRRDDGVAVFDQGVVHPVHDILEVTLARCSQNHPLDTRAVEVLAETFTVTPLAGVVDQYRILDAVLGVIHARGFAGVDHTDIVAVGDDGAFFLV